MHIRRQEGCGASPARSGGGKRATGAGRRPGEVRRRRWPVGAAGGGEGSASARGENEAACARGKERAGGARSRRRRLPAAGVGDDGPAPLGRREAD